MGTLAVINNGHTIEINFPENGAPLPIIHEGGPLLKDSYVLSKIHFHWGKHDRNGNEHNVNEKKYMFSVQVFQKFNF